MKLGKLVIERHYEPVPPEEMAGILHRVYDRLFDPATLERLTTRRLEDTMLDEATYEGSDLQAG